MSLFEDTSTTTVDELALREALTVSTDCTVRDAVLKMREKNLGCVFVVDESQHPVGVFTEAMLRSLLARNPAELNDPVVDQMDQQVPHVFRDDTVDLMLEALDLQNTRFLAVLNEDKTLYALTGQKGLMEFVAGYFPYEVFGQSLNTPDSSPREGA